MKNNSWSHFIKKNGDNPLNTKPFWNKISEMRGKKVSSSIPTLTENNIMYETDQAKANLFANKLKETFTDADDTRFDEKFKKEVCNYLEKNNLNEDAHQDKDYFSTSEFNKVVKGLKKHCSPGKDEIHNLLLINASSEFKKILLQLCNLTTKWIRRTFPLT